MVIGHLAVFSYVLPLHGVEGFILNLIMIEKKMKDKREFIIVDFKEKFMIEDYKKEHKFL